MFKVDDIVKFKDNEQDSLYNLDYFLSAKTLKVLEVGHRGYSDLLLLQGGPYISACYADRVELLYRYE